jgi:hypothetical protein
MPESMNVEVAHRLSEPKRTAQYRERWHGLVETAEVVLLAIVAVATAWSGFQAARWEGHQSLLYGEASRDRFQADAAATQGGQLLLGDLTLFSGWLQAHAKGDAQLQAIYERRFSPEYRTAFTAWLETDPFGDRAPAYINPNSPPGPSYMPEYRNPPNEEAARLNAQASATFDQGTQAREIADKYVRDTVLFATVLFVVALAQRFATRAVRIGANVVAVGLLVFTLGTVVILPRI